MNGLVSSGSETFMVGGGGGIRHGFGLLKIYYMVLRVYGFGGAFKRVEGASVLKTRLF